MKRAHDFQIGDRVNHRRREKFGAATVVHLDGREDVWLDFDLPGASSTKHDCDGLAKPRCGYRATYYYLTRVPYSWRKL